MLTTTSSTRTTDDEYFGSTSRDMAEKTQDELAGYLTDLLWKSARYRDRWNSYADPVPTLSTEALDALPHKLPLINSGLSAWKPSRYFSREGGIEAEPDHAQLLRRTVTGRARAVSVRKWRPVLIERGDD